MNGGRRWNQVGQDVAAELKQFLLEKGATEDHSVRSAHERWRVRLSDATVTYYAGGTLYSTGFRDPVVQQAWDWISDRVGSTFQTSTREFFIGLDETGKGEVVGHQVLAGVCIPTRLVMDLEGLVSAADTKKKRTPEHWDELYRSIDRFRPGGLRTVVERIPPWHIDRYNINKIMDVVYQRVLSVFLRSVEPTSCRIVVDDYGVGRTLDRFLKALEKAGAEVVIASGADARFLEAKLASVVAKRERERAIQAINRSEEFQIDGTKVGSGNIGDQVTVAWLEKWKGSGRPWPWFVKRSFQPVRRLDGLADSAKKHAPPIRDDILSPQFIEEFEQGRLSITALSVVCPACGAVSRGALLTEGTSGWVGRCLSCKEVIPDLAFTLRYYCGYVVLDTNAVGVLRKDLEGHRRLFEGWTVVITSVVQSELDAKIGKQQLGRIAEFSAMGRITLDAAGGSVLDDLTSIQRDELIVRAALEKNAILLTGDQNMRAAAQSRGLFTLFV